MPKPTLTQHHVNDVLSLLQKQQGLSRREARRWVASVLAAIQDATPTGSRLTLRGFGTFFRYTQPARPARNLHTGEVLEIPEREVFRFRSIRPGSPTDSNPGES